MENANIKSLQLLKSCYRTEITQWHTFQTISETYLSELARDMLKNFMIDTYKNVV